MAKKVKSNTEKFSSKNIFHPDAKSTRSLSAREKRKKESWNLVIIAIFVAILLLSFFLRFYRLRDFIIFLGDQGRDVWVVKKMLIDGKFTLLGPVASVGGFYLGPIYYYIIAPFLWLTGFDPIGPAIFIASLGVVTTIIIFQFVKQHFSPSAAIISAFFYAVSPMLVQFNRFSWNPNAVFFFSIIFYIFLFSALNKMNKNHMLIAGIIIGVLFQLHYLAFLYLPTAIIIISLELRKNIKSLLIYSIFLISGLIIGWSPFIIYEFRHSFQNFNGIITFMTRNDANTVGLDFGRLMSSVRTDSSLIISNLFHVPSLINTIIRLSIVGYVGCNFFSKNKSRRILSLFVISVFCGLIFYKGKMEAHYLNIIYIFVLIVIADLLDIASKIHFSIPIIFIVIMIYYFFPTYFFKIPPNKQLDQTIDISRFVLDKVGKEKFNFALITKTNSDHAYRYFFDLWGNESVEIKPDDKGSITQTLIVLCEPLTRNCDPRGNPIWEIAGFGHADIVQQWERGVYKIYKMKHLKQ